MISLIISVHFSELLKTRVSRCFPASIYYFQSVQKVWTPLPLLPYSTDNPFFLSFWTYHFLTFFDVRSLQNNFACFFYFSKRYRAEIRFEILISTSLVSKGVKRIININEKLAEQIALLLQNSYITDGNQWLLPSFYRQLSLYGLPSMISKISSPLKLRGRHTMLLKVNNKDTKAVSIKSFQSL